MDRSLGRAMGRHRRPRISRASASNLPPPIVPTIRPSAKISIFVPASRGTEPRVAATVASTQGWRRSRAAIQFGDQPIGACARDGGLDLRRAVRRWARTASFAILRPKGWRSMSRQCLFGIASVIGRSLRRRPAPLLPFRRAWSGPTDCSFPRKVSSSRVDDRGLAAE